MTTGRAQWIFERIEDSTYTDREKIDAIKIIAEMETHNAILKTEIIAAIRWILKRIDV